MEKRLFLKKSGAKSSAQTSSLLPFRKHNWIWESLEIASLLPVRTSAEKSLRLLGRSLEYPGKPHHIFSPGASLPFWEHVVSTALLWEQDSPFNTVAAGMAWADEPEKWCRDTKPGGYSRRGLGGPTRATWKTSTVIHSTDTSKATVLPAPTGCQGFLLLALYLQLYFCTTQPTYFLTTTLWNSQADRKWLAQSHPARS